MASATRDRAEPTRREPPGVSRPFAGEDSLPRWLCAESQRGATVTWTYAGLLRSSANGYTRLRCMCFRPIKTDPDLAQFTTHSLPEGQVVPSPLPADLQAIVDAWDDLPAPICAAMLAMVQASKK
jgi:hypothetical protein